MNDSSSGNSLKLANSADNTSDGCCLPDIVALVASAGGLQPLQTIFKAIPGDTGAAYFVLQHLSSEQDSFLPDLISQSASLPVAFAEDGERITANRIYVCAPGTLLELQDGCIRVWPNKNTGQRQKLFDVFLEAVSSGPYKQVIAVILSGAGDDGRKGATILRQQGGLVLVQEPETAEFRSMPDQTIGVSAPDLILPPEKIGPMLVALLKDSKKSLALETDSSAYLQILALLRKTCKIDFSRYKTTTVQRRISRRLLLNSISDNMEAYLDLLDRSVEERWLLTRDLLIGVSAFFRDPEVFDLIRKDYLPVLMAEKEGREFRIWIAGCASGEEAYSFAMLCLEYIEESGVNVDLKVLASDINQESIHRANLGIYPENLLEQVPRNLLDKYCDKVEQGYQFNSAVRKRVIFFQHDLTEDIPFSNVDLISCRNVFIYLKPEIQLHVIRCLGFGLRVGGMLMLSPSESLGGDSCFEVLDERWRLYRLVRKPRVVATTVPSMRYGMDQSISTDRAPAIVSSNNREEMLRERILQLVVGRYVPLLLVLNPSGEIVYVLGDSRGILHIPSGEPVSDLSRLADVSLRLPITTGLRKLAKSGEEQVYHRVPVQRGENESQIDIRMCRLSGRANATPLIAVLFENIEQSNLKSTPAEAVEICNLDELTLQRVANLEEELYFTKQSLRTAVEELEATNEELQSANEEMQSGNEELQSTNEELQSTNEELIVVNREYQQKVSQLSELNDDMNNLMLSADVMTLFVDENKRIRQASPGARRLLSLTPQDIGRPVEHVSHKLLETDIEQLIDEVLDSGQASEVADQTADGRLFVIQMNPFVTSDDKLSGVTLNFVDVTTIRQTETEMNRLAAVVMNSDDAILVHNIDGDILFWNCGAEKLYGYSEEEALQLNVFQLMPEGYDKQARKAIKAALAGKNAGAIESKRLTRSGKELSVRLTYTYLPDESANMPVIAAIEHDITEQKKLTNEVRLAAVAFQTIDGIMVTDSEGYIQRVNHAFTTITGYREDEVIGRKPSILHSGRQDAGFYQHMWKSLAEEGTWTGEIWNKNKSGQVYPEWLTINAVKNEQDAVSHYIGVFRDTSEKKSHEAKIHQLAFFDPLTELPNRRLFNDRMRQATIFCRRKKTFGALLFIDLDRFKTINDSLGHSIGDELLKQVGVKLKASLRAGDTVARLGGDEFVIVIVEVGKNEHEAVTYSEKFAKKIMQEFQEPFVIGTHALHTSPSIGVTLFPSGEDAEADFLRQADNAMYLAKKMGRNTIRFFDPSLQAAADSWLSLEKALRVAIKEQQFVLYYQPQFDARKGCESAEALIRWNRPGFGMVPPNEFIPICEDTGLIKEIGKWVIQEATRQLANWQSSGVTSIQRIAVNVSPQQFKSRSFESDIHDALASSSLQHGSLELEITENLLLDEIGSVSDKMSRLKQQGVRFSIDDFGTGYSSLSYIKRLPINKIKIDQTFVRDILIDKDDANIVESTVAMVSKMGLEIVAEGVETKEQETFLRDCGCYYYQGFLYSKPLPADAFVERVAALNAAFEKNTQVSH